MSQADIETLRAGYEAGSRGDLEGAFRDVHPDFELQAADRVPSPGTYRGPEEARRFIEDMLEPFEEVTAEPEEFFENGDRIAVILHLRYRPRGSSAEMENRVGHLWTMRDGKAARLQIFLEREKALEAAGLRE
ncbi:MAG: nuclear transport factor 2 family protein [Actinomycetota bacterium]